MRLELSFSNERLLPTPPKENIRTRGKAKLTSFPRDHTLSVLLYTVFGLCNRAVVFGAQATTTQLYPGRDTFKFDQGHVTKNQSITVLILLNERVAI